MSALSLIRKIEFMLEDDTIEKETRQLLEAAIEDTRNKGIEEDIKSGWYSIPEICRRWAVGPVKVTAMKKRLKKKTP
jgi:hypothetical protein